MVDHVIPKMAAVPVNLVVREKPVIFVRWDFLVWIACKIVLYAKTPQQVDVMQYQASAFVHLDTRVFTALIRVQVENTEMAVVSNVNVATVNVITCQARVSVKRDGPETRVMNHVHVENMVTTVRTRATVTMKPRVTLSTAGANVNQDTKVTGVRKPAPRAITVMVVTLPVNVHQRISCVTQLLVAFVNQDTKV